MGLGFVLVFVLVFVVFGRFDGRLGLGFVLVFALVLEVVLQFGLTVVLFDLDFQFFLVREREREHPVGVGRTDDPAVRGDVDIRCRTVTEHHRHGHSSVVDVGRCAEFAVVPVLVLALELELEFTLCLSAGCFDFDLLTVGQCHAESAVLVGRSNGLLVECDGRPCDCIARCGYPDGHVLTGSGYAARDEDCETAGFDLALVFVFGFVLVLVLGRADGRFVLSLVFVVFRFVLVFVLVLGRVDGRFVLSLVFVFGFVLVLELDFLFEFEDGAGLTVDGDLRFAFGASVVDELELVGSVVGGDTRRNPLARLVREGPACGVECLGL